MTLLLLVLMTGAVGAFKNEPYGWQGWAWGTSLKDVSGWLMYDGRTSRIFYDGQPVIYSYLKQSETTYQLGIKWDQVVYDFINNYFAGVCLILHGESVPSAKNTMIRQFGTPTKSDYIGYIEVTIWVGEYSTIAVVAGYGKNPADSMMMTYIGTKDYNIANLTEWQYRTSGY